MYTGGVSRGGRDLDDCKQASASASASSSSWLRRPSKESIAVIIPARLWVAKYHSVRSVWKAAFFDCSAESFGVSPGKGHKSRGMRRNMHVTGAAGPAGKGLAPVGGEMHPIGMSPDGYPASGDIPLTVL